MNSGSDAQINGTTIVWKEFEIKQGTAASKFALTGNLIADTVWLRGRTSWVSVGHLGYRPDRIQFTETYWHSVLP